MRGKYHLNELDDWIETKYKNEANRVRKSLKIQLKKEDGFQKNKKERNLSNTVKKPYICSTPNISIKEGVHLEMLQCHHVQTFLFLLIGEGLLALYLSSHYCNEQVWIYCPPLPN